MKRISYIQLKNGQKIMERLNKRLESVVSELDMIRLQNAIFDYIGSNNAVLAVGIDSHYNVWVKGTNIGGKTKTKTFVVIAGEKNRRYKQVKGCLQPFNLIATSLNTVYSN